MGSTEEQSILQPPILPQEGVESPPTEFQVKSENIVKLAKVDSTKEAYRMVRKTGETIVELTELAEETGCDIADLVVVWSKIPVENQEGSDSLAESGEAIIALSDAVDKAVDKRYPGMPAHEKTAKKLRIMAKLINSKAELLESNN